MAKMKNLKTNGSGIKEHKVEQISQGSSKAVLVKIKCEKDYEFIVRKDENHPDVDVIENSINNAIQDCIDNFKNLEVKKYKERNYLFINGVPYTGQQQK